MVPEKNCEHFSKNFNSTCEVKVGHDLFLDGLKPANPAGISQEFSASRFGDSTMAAVRYDISVLPFECLVRSVQRGQRASDVIRGLGNEAVESAAY